MGGKSGDDTVIRVESGREFRNVNTTVNCAARQTCALAIHVKIGLTDFPRLYYVHHSSRVRIIYLSAATRYSCDTRVNFHSAFKFRSFRRTEP